MADSRERRRWLLAALATALGVLVVILAPVIAPLRQAEAGSYDWRMRACAAPFPPSAITLVLIDDATLRDLDEEFGIRWPYERMIYTPVYDALVHHGAEQVVFDVLFPERGDGDEDFAASMHELPTLLATMADRGEGDDPLAWPVTVAGGEALHEHALHPLVPNPTLRAAARGGGHIDTAPDPDGVLRRAPLLIAGAEAISPALALAVVLAERDDPPVRYVDGELHIGSQAVPLARDGTALVAWRALDEDFPRISFKDLLFDGMRLQQGVATELDSALLRDRTVFVGLSGGGTFDLRATPISNEDIGVRMHAAVLEGLRQDRFIRQVPSWVAILAATLLLGLVASGTLALPRLSAQIAVGVGALALWTALALLLFRYGGWWLPLIGPLFAVLLAFTAGAVANYLNEGRERRFIRRSFQNYLSPLVIEELVRDPSRLRLGGERREITPIFTDLAGFTTLSESMSPDALVELLNEYLTAMTDIILEEGGTIDKYEGDAIIAIFGAPVTQSDHAARAARAALRCQTRLDELRHEWADRELPPLHMRIGLNSGPAVVGNIGSRQRFDYTMIGDTVNLAARLEGANKAYGTFTMCSGATWQQLGAGFVGRCLDLVAVKGKAEAVPVYELLGRSDEQDPRRDELVAGFAAARERYLARDFAAAAARFDELATAHDDEPSRIFAERCRALATDPPGDDWDGVYRMTTK